MGTEDTLMVIKDWWAGKMGNCSMSKKIQLFKMNKFQRSVQPGPYSYQGTGLFKIC